MIKLTKRQQEILDLIESHLNKTGSPPTRAEIAKLMGFRSPNAAEDHLRALARKGAIELVPGTSRGIRLAGTSAGVPVITNIKYGQTVLTSDNIDKFCKIDRNLFQPAIDYILHWTLGPLSELGIAEGDYLAMHQTDQFSPNQLVLVHIEDEVTFKRYSNSLRQTNPIIEGIVLGIIRPLTKTNLI